MTLDVSHVVPTMQEDATARIEAALFAPASEPGKVGTQLAPKTGPDREGH
jgi:hypothetical protein